MGLFSDAMFGGNESEEQPAFWRTHKAREQARQARLHSRRERERAEKAAKAKRTVKVRGQKKK